LSLAADEAVLELRRKTVIVPLAYLEVVRTRPTSWTLIPSERYAVCPNCAERLAVGRPPERLRCPRCQGVFDVDLKHPQVAPA
jgi:tRNA(Ile2) C34 agmatinyltransferase TiaS